MTFMGVHHQIHRYSQHSPKHNKYTAVYSNKDWAHNIKYENHIYTYVSSYEDNIYSGILFSFFRMPSSYNAGRDTNI